MALRKMQDPQVDLSAEDNHNEKQEEILDLREENEEVAKADKELEKYYNKLDTEQQKRQ